MQKTVKKNKKGGSGKRLSYIVTENGLVENDELVKDDEQTRRGSRRGSNSRSLIVSMTEVADAKQKFKALANRKKISSEPHESIDNKKEKGPTMKDPKAALAEINAAEANRRRSSITIADIADTKRILGLVPKHKNKMPSLKTTSKKDSVETFRIDDKEAAEDELGLLESDKIKRTIQQVGSALLSSKAIALMNGPRRHRQARLKSVIPF